MRINLLLAAIMSGWAFLAWPLPVQAAPDAQAPSGDAAGDAALKAKLDSLQQLRDAAMDHIMKGQVAAATKLLNRCIRLEKRYPGCHRVLGMIYDQQGARRKAALEYRTYLRLTQQPDDAESVHGLMMPLEPLLLNSSGGDD